MAPSASWHHRTYEFNEHLHFTNWFFYSCHSYITLPNFRLIHEIFTELRVELSFGMNKQSDECTEWRHYLSVPKVMITKMYYSDLWYDVNEDYHKVSTKRCTKSQNLNVSHLVLQLSLPNPLKPGVEFKMSANRRCSNYIWVINNFIAC